jgi:DNA-binding protein YbaB
MNDREEQMGEVIVTMNSKKQVQGITIAPEVIRKFLAPTLD